MGYEQSILKRLKEHTGDWIELDRPDFLDELNSLADELINKGTVEGYLAALLIYHQLCEELVRLLIKDAQFFIQLSVFPSQIEFSENKRATFGQVTDELKSTVSFENKDEFIEKCLQLNKYRVDIVHHLTKKPNISDIKHELSDVKVLFDEIFKLFDDAHDSFRATFGDFKDDLLELYEDEYHDK